jgi:hypothetical protein
MANLAFSFCCSRDGCRKRHRVPSTRFLGRFTYFALFVVLATALIQGPDAGGLLTLKSMGVPLRAIRYWQKWWGSTFATSSFWMAMKGRISDANKLLPLNLWNTFRQSITEGYGAAMKKLLSFLAPYPHQIGPFFMMAPKNPQKMDADE